MKIVTQDVRKLSVTAGTTYYLTFPQEMIRQLGWKKGQKKVIRLEEGKIVISDWKELRESHPDTPSNCRSRLRLSRANVGAGRLTLRLRVGCGTWVENVVEGGCAAMFTNARLTPNHTLDS